MKKYVSLQVGLVLALVFALLPRPLAAAPRSDDDCTEDEVEFDEYENQVVVKLVDPTAMHIIDDIAATLDLQVVETVLASRGVYLLQADDMDDAEDLDDQIEDGWSTDILYAEANYTGNVPEANPSMTWAWGGLDPTPGESQYAGDLVNLTAAQQIAQGAGITVAVLDTGIQLSHPAFTNTLVAGYDFVDDDDVPEDVWDMFMDDDGDGIPSEAYGHGTHVAGIVHYVAPAAKIMPLRVLNSDGGGNVFVIAEAILYAAENGADVISLSLGTTYESDVLKDAVEDAFDTYGVVIVAAAGNQQANQRQYPAGFEKEVIAVSSIDENSVKATTANYGCWVDIVAPGEQIFSAFPMDSYAWWSGTSMATPFIAGEAALLLSANNGRTDSPIVETILQHTVSVTPENPTYDGQLGTGRPDFAAAMTAVPTQIGLVHQATSTTFHPRTLYAAVLCTAILTRRLSPLRIQKCYWLTCFKYRVNGL